MSERSVIGSIINFVVAFGIVAGCGGAARAQAAFQAQEVKMDGAGVSLAGTLLVPKLAAGRRAPALLIVPESNSYGRNGVKAGNATHDIYKSIAESLAARGIAVLRYDIRCTGASECKAAETFNDYIDDAHGAYDFLKKHAQIDPAQLYIVGHGEGGIIASTIASQEDGKMAGLALAASPGRYFGKWFREMLPKMMAEEGKSRAEIDAFLQKFDRVAIGITSTTTDFSFVKLDPKDRYDAMLLGMIEKRRVVVSLLVNDPLQIAASVKSPVLILQGAKDLEIGVKDGQFLEEALKRVYNPDVRLVIVDNMDHLLRTNTGAPSFASYGGAPKPVDPLFLKSISEWISTRVKP